MTEGVDVAAPELGGEPLAVPVRQQAHHDDRPLDRGRQALPGRAPSFVSQRLDATGRVALPPAIQARPTGTEGEGRGDALLMCDADAADPKAQTGEILFDPGSGWPPAARGQEQEPRSLLISMAKRSTVWIGADARHAATLRTSSKPMFH